MNYRPESASFIDFISIADIDKLTQVLTNALQKNVNDSHLV